MLKIKDMTPQQRSFLRSLKTRVAYKEPTPTLQVLMRLGLMRLGLVMAHEDQEAGCTYYERTVAGAKLSMQLARIENLFFTTDVLGNKHMRFQRPQK